MLTNTIGMVRVSCWSDTIVVLPTLTITSGASETNSAAPAVNTVAIATGQANVDL